MVRGLVVICFLGLILISSSKLSAWVGNGGKGDDTLIGTSQADSIYGNEGNDLLEGRGNNDLLVGGAGTDILKGGDGNDNLFGQIQPIDNYNRQVSDGSRDQLWGEGGNDFIFSLGSNFIDGGPGDDVIYQFSGSSWSSPGGLAQDVKNFYQNAAYASGFYFTAGNEEGVSPEIYGREGDDVISVYRAAVLDAGPGNDFVCVKTVEGDSQGYDGGSGYDTLTVAYDVPGAMPGDESERIHSFDFAKVRNFEQLIFAGWQHGEAVLPDSLAEGIAAFTVVIAQRSSEMTMTVDASAEQSCSYIFKIPSNEYNYSPKLILRGGGGDDTIQVGGQGDQLVGNGGNDELFGRDGNDALTGGPGNDVIDGGDGFDTAVFSGNYQNYAVTVVSPTLQDEGYLRIVGIDGTDHLYGINQLQFEDQTVAVDVPGMISVGTNGNDASLLGGEGNDDISGLGGDDVISGRLGNDTLKGGPGNDLLVGGAGTDILKGGDGNDNLFGQIQLIDNYNRPVSDGSRDQLWGEGGNDFIFSLGSNFIDGGPGDDVIYQFSGSSWVSPGYLAQLAQDFYKNLPEACWVFGISSWGGEPSSAPEIYGGEGLDVIMVHHAAVIDGGPGNDFVIVRDVREESQGYDGGTGYDTLIVNKEANLGMPGEDPSLIQFMFSKVFNFEQLVFTESMTGSVVLPNSLAQGIEEFTVLIATRNSSYLKVDATEEQTSRYIFKVPRNQINTGFDPYSGAPSLILLGGAVGDTMEGGIRGDQLVGNGGDDMLYGLGGNDTLTGGPGNDVIDGGDGEDTAVFAGNRAAYVLQIVAPTLQEEGYVQISGPDGVDNLYGINSLQFADQTIPVDVPGLILQGTQNNDSSLRGGEGNDEIYGLGGNDSLFGFLGNDHLDGGFGDDLLLGGDGEDRLYGGAGDDQLFGQVQPSNNFDQPVSDGSKDYLYGNEGNDFIFSLGSNYIDGGSGQDVIYQFSGSSWVSPSYLAQAVNNFYANPSYASGFYFYCGSESGAAPEVYGGEGDDVITVHHAAVIDGGPGNDFVIVKDVEEGSQGYDGGVGYDTLVATYEPGWWWDGDPDDRVHAFRFTKLSNFEQLVLAGWQAGKVVLPDSLAQGIEEFTVIIAQRGIDSPLKIDATAEQTSRYVFKVPADEYYYSSPLILLGGAAGDTMEGGIRGDQLVGNGGDDMIFGRAGNDTLTGGPGNDVIDGGNGEDTAVFSGNRDAYTIDEGIGQVVISGPDGLDTVRNINQYVFDDQTVTQVFQGLYLVGTEAPDTLEGGNSDDTALGLGGNDAINGGGGNDELGGGEGADLINGGTGNDQISGDEGNDTEQGGDGNDMLSGGGGNDELVGGDGNDVVSGGDGNDLIIGGSGAGDDTYTGGPGIDTVKYTSAKAAIRVDLTLANNNATSVGANDAAGIGNDQIEGVESVIAGKFNDVLKGDNADNQFTGDSGNDSIDGAGGRDTAVYTGARNQYSLVKRADRVVTVTDNRSGASDGVDTMSNVEVLQFSDSQVLVSSLPISNNPNPPSILDINSDLSEVSVNLGASFSHQITASGSPTSFGAIRLPPGLKLNAKTGLISGKPTKVGTFSATLQALKKGSTTATVTKVFTVVQVPTFTYAATINAKKGKALNVAPKIAGYPAPTFSILTGSLPPGMSLNASTAAITGTPTTIGTYPFTVRGSNSVGNTDRSTTIVVK